MEAGALTAATRRPLDPRAVAARRGRRPALPRRCCSGSAALVLVLIAFFFVTLIVGVAPRVLEVRRSSASSSTNDWNVSRRPSARWPLRRRHAHHLGDRAAHRRAGRRRHGAVRHRAVPAAAAHAADDPRRAARRGPVGRLRPLGLLRPRAQARGRRAVSSPTSSRSCPSSAARVAGPNYFIAGLILAIMILPIVSAISREVDRDGARRPQGGGARARRDALGDDPDGGPARTRARASPARRCSASAARSARRSR